MNRRRGPAALALGLGGLLAAVLMSPVAAQDQSLPPLGPPAATPIASPPAVPSGDGTGVRLHTELGDIVIGLFTESSPVAAENFLDLAGAGFYDGTVFHRIVPDFVIQGGDPTGTGSGDAGYSIVDEPVVGEYGRGIVAMARTQEPDSQGSQFFIVLDDAARGALERYRTYAIFGRVVEGMDVVDAIAAGPTSGDQALEPVAIESTSIEQVVLPAEPTPPPPTMDEALARSLAITVSGQVLATRSITGPALASAYAPDDPTVAALRAMVEASGATLEDLSIAAASADLPSGQPLDITALRISGTDAAQHLLPFARIILQDDAVTSTPATVAGKEVFTLAMPGQPFPITAYVNGDTLFLITTPDEATRDEVLSQLP